jgi:hypothetical protein
MYRRVLRRGRDFRIFPMLEWLVHFVV